MEFVSDTSNIVSTLEEFLLIHSANYRLVYKWNLVLKVVMTRSAKNSPSSKYSWGSRIFLISEIFKSTCKNASKKAPLSSGFNSHRELTTIPQLYNRSVELKKNKR